VWNSKWEVRSGCKLGTYVQIEKSGLWNCTICKLSIEDGLFWCMEAWAEVQQSSSACYYSSEDIDHLAIAPSHHSKNTIKMLHKTPLAMQPAQAISLPSE